MGLGYFGKGWCYARVVGAASVNSKLDVHGSG